MTRKELRVATVLARRASCSTAWGDTMTKQELCLRVMKALMLLDYEGPLELPIKVEAVFRDGPGKPSQRGTEIMPGCWVEYMNVAELPVKE